MVENSALVAIEILTGVLVFTTGFLSIRLHALRDRTLDRTQTLRDLLDLRARTQEPVTSADVGEMASAFEDGARIDPIAWWTVGVNAVTFSVICWLSYRAVESAELSLTLVESRASMDTRVLTGVMAVALLIALTGVFDVVWVRRDVRRRYERSLVGRFFAAAALLVDKEWAEAEAAHTYLSLEAPTWPWLFSNRGLARSQLGKLGGALHDFEKAIDLDPEDAMLWSHKGNALRALGRFDDALEAHERALTLAPHRADVLINYATTLAELDRRAEAENALDRAIELDPEDPDGWYNRGLVAYEGGDYEQAVEDYTAAISRDVESSWGYFANRGHAHAKLRRRDLAERDFHIAIGLDPTNWTLWFDLSNIRMRDGDSAKALHAIDRAIALAPDEPRLHNNRAMLLLRLDQLDDALSAISRAIELADRSGSVDAVYEANRALIAEAINNK